MPIGSYLSKYGYVVRKDSITDDELKILKTELIAKPLCDDKYISKVGPRSTYPIYIETKNKLYIPKMYGINRYGDPKRYMPNYTGKPWDNIDLTFNGVLFENQKEPVNALINACKNNGGGILKAGTGIGKTYMSINVLSQLKIKTIIIVNKIPLMHQWKNELESLIPGISIGIIQGQKNVQVEGNDVVIAMLQSLARIQYPDSLFEDFGLAIFDEIHNTSSRVFSKVLSKLCCKYTIGLSATPNRSDGCEYVFKYHIGDIVYNSNSKRDGLPPILNIIRIDSSEYKEINTINKITGQSQIQYTSMLSELTIMPKRNKIILEIIRDLVVREGRKILVLSDRREHLKQLKNILDNDLAVNFTYGLFLGQMKQNDLARSRSSQVILATFSAFGEGVSEKDLDTLILITPKKFIGHLKKSTKNENGKLEQIVGRIFRKNHIDKNPLIVDLQDNFSVYKNQSHQRRMFYKQYFKNSIVNSYAINLDDYDIDQLNMDCIQKIRTTRVIKDNDIGESNSTLENNVMTTLLSQCVIDD